MILNTRLILIEGLPGAGKSSTAVQLGPRLQGSGLACRWYLEEDPQDDWDGAYQQMLRCLHQC